MTGPGPTVPAETTPPWTAREWLTLACLAAAQFCQNVGFLLLIPLGPRLVLELDLNPGQLAAAISVYTIAAGVGGLLGLRLIDSTDRRPMLLVCLAVFCLASGGTGLATGFRTLLLSRAVAGAAGGLLGSIILAVIGDLFPERHRGRAIGVLMTAFSLAMIAGVPGGLLLSQGGAWGTPYLVLSVVAAAVTLALYLSLPPLRHHLTAANPGDDVSLAFILFHGRHLLAYALTVCLMVTTFIVIPYIPTYLHFNVGVRQEDLVYVYLVGGAVTFLTQPVIGWLSDRLGKRPLFLVLCPVAAGPLLWMTHLPPVPLAHAVAVTTLVMVLTSGRWVPGLALLSGCARPSYRGRFMSVQQAVQQLSTGLAALLGSALVAEAADHSLIGFDTTGVVAGALALASTALAFWLHPVPSS